MKKQIGVVGVDSGQILVCDPCYIDSQWKNEDFNIPRKYRHIDGTILQYEKDFPHYEAVIPKYGKTMNQINADHEAVELPDDEPSKYPFSYNACCKKTCNDDMYNGQLNYEMGHAGVGVVTSSGYGDGVYPVIADYTKDGRVKSITVVFIDDDGEFPLFDDSEERRDFCNDDDGE